MDNEFNPSSEVKEAIQNFNIDFNSRCADEDTINEKILKEIREELLQKEVDKYLFSLSRDPKITKEINHSKFPDDVVLNIINTKGIKIDSISILKSFEATEIKEPNKCGYVFGITFESMVNKILIEYSFCV